MEAARYNLDVIPQHLPFSLSEKNGDAIDLTGATITAQITIGEVTRSFNVGNGGIVIDSNDPTLGKWNLVISADDVEAFSRRIGSWSMKVVFVNGDEWPLAKGDASL